MLHKFAKIPRYLSYYAEDLGNMSKYYRHYQKTAFNLQAFHKGFEDRLTQKDTRSVSERVLCAYKASIKDQKKAATVYQLGGEWDHILHVEYARFMQALETGNVEALDRLLKNFCRNECSRGLAMSSSFMAMRYRLLNKFSFLSEFHDNLTRWRKFTGEEFIPENFSFPPVGNPIGLMVNGSLIPVSAPRHWYYARQILDLKPSPAVIAEIGGGFGALAYYLFRQTKTPLRYLNFDLPEIVAVMSYFIIQALPDKKVGLYGEAANLQQALSSNDILAYPNFSLTELAPKSVDVFFNSCSLTEMDEETVREYYRIIALATRHFFMHVNHDDDKIYDKASGKRHIKISEYELPGGAFKATRFKQAAMHDERYFEYLYQRVNE